MIAQRDALLTARFGGARGRSNNGRPSIAANGLEMCIATNALCPGGVRLGHSAMSALLTNGRLYLTKSCERVDRATSRPFLITCRRSGCSRIASCTEGAPTTTRSARLPGEMP
jgi:hypothetical protein